MKRRRISATASYLFVRTSNLEPQKRKAAQAPPSKIA
jgi:hypothetical protein